MPFLFLYFLLWVQTIYLGISSSNWSQTDSYVYTYHLLCYTQNQYLTFHLFELIHWLLCVYLYMSGYFWTEILSCSFKLNSNPLTNIESYNELLDILPPSLPSLSIRTLDSFISRKFSSSLQTFFLSPLKSCTIKSVSLLACTNYIFAIFSSSIRIRQ